MNETQKIVWSLAILLWLHDNPAFAAQGCCSMHGGVAGCAGAKKLCNDGTLSSTCSCHGPEDAPSIPQAQNGLALLEPTPQEVKPYITPVEAPSPTAPTDVTPSLGENKPYVTPVAHPGASTQGDAIPALEPPEPYSAQGISQSPPEKKPRSLDDPSSLEGTDSQGVEDIIPKGWVKEPTSPKKGSGIRYRNPAKPGEQIRVMPGKANDPNPIKRSPYVRVSKNGQVSDPIPLKGNPTLK